MGQGTGQLRDPHGPDPAPLGPGWPWGPFFYPGPPGHWKCVQRLRLCISLLPGWPIVTSKEGHPAASFVPTHGQEGPFAGAGARAALESSPQTEDLVCQSVRPTTILLLRARISAAPAPGTDSADVSNVLTLTKCYFGTGVNCNLYPAAFYAGKRTHPNGSQLAKLSC